MPEHRTSFHVRALMANVDEGLVVVDVDGRVCLFNETAEQLFGVTRADVIGHPASKKVKTQETLPLGRLAGALRDSFCLRAHS